MCVLLLQDLLQSCSRGGRRRVEDFEVVEFVAESLVFSSGRLCGGRGSVTSLVPMRARTGACWVVFGLMLTAGVGPSAAFHGPAALRAPGAPPNFPPLPFIFLLPILSASRTVMRCYHVHPWCQMNWHIFRPGACSLAFCANVLVSARAEAGLRGCAGLRLRAFSHVICSAEVLGLGSRV